MTERKKDALYAALLLALLILFFSKILFTAKIIRAPDIANEYYWYVLDQAKLKFLDFFRIDLSSAGWDMLPNSGTSVGGGTNSFQFLMWRNLIYYFIPAPTSVAWFILLHLWFGALGTYFCCRLIGASRLASFAGGLLFALAPETATLINAGHVMKIATISFAPWAFYLFEKGFQTRRLIYFLATGFLLAFQFFNIHWQIAFYTCLALGIYGIARTVGIILAERQHRAKEAVRLLGLNLAVLVFFLTTVSISLLPLSSWSKDTNRGSDSGANVVATTGGAAPQAKGGLDREEAMSWSLPPEELGSFVIPGLFGLSRQEGGENPTNITSYYWGRMRFTQTQTYMGLLPWLLLPLPLIFRRDRYTWLALSAIVVGTLFSMGKYTPFYNLLFDYFPGIDRFRVPKMMMFIPLMGLGVLAARGVDLLLDAKLRGTRAFRRYVVGVGLLPVALLLVLGAELAGRDFWINQMLDLISQPTRYEESSAQLVLQRWGNLVTETGIAAGLAALCAAVIALYYRGKLAAKALPFVLLALFLADVGRVNAKFLFLVDEPHRETGVKVPEIAFIARAMGGSKEFRALPMGGDPMPYVSAGIPVLFTSNPVQQRRWQEFLDGLNLGSGMLDMLNVRFLIYPRDQYEREREAMGGKYAPVFLAPDGQTVVLENRTVLPKAWLVAAAVPVAYGNSMPVLQNPAFDPGRMALVESAPPIPMANPNAPPAAAPGQVRVVSYQSEKIELEASTGMNALLVLGEKYYNGWRATVDGKDVQIYPVDHVLRGVYLTPGKHRIEFIFDPVPYKVGKYLTLASFAFFLAMLGREFRLRRRGQKTAAAEVAG